jgi:hypothetical protein
MLANHKEMKNVFVLDGSEAEPLGGHLGQNVGDCDSHTLIEWYVHSLVIGLSFSAQARLMYT